jgi:molybdopterin molybdotransferase
MISVEKATNIIIENSQDFGTEEISIHESPGRILAQEIIADRPFPPFNRVCMDGIAIAYQSYKLGHRTFQVESVGAAGDPIVTLQDPLKCIEIMTGAPLPVNTDTVIRYEDLMETSAGFKIMNEVAPDKNIHYTGTDHTQGQVLINYNSRIGASEIGVMATVGCQKVKVKKYPRIALISSGEELVNISDQPLAHQIRKSNVYVLQSRLRELGLTSDNYHFKDDTIDIVNKVRNLVDHYDVLMISGGVSKGKFDFIPSVLENLRFVKLFHRVSQRPGKPFWFGRKRNKTVFAFPGNPVSSFLCFHKYFLTWMKACHNQDYHSSLKVTLLNDVTFKPDLTYFAQAKLMAGKDSRLYAEVRHGNGSGDLVNPTINDGFVELPQGKNLFKKGEIVNFIPYRPVF